MNLHLLLPEFLVAALGFGVLVADFFLPHERKNTLAVISVLGLIGLLAFTLVFLLGRGSTPLYGGIFLVDGYSLFFKAFFLVMGGFVVLTSVDFVKKHLSHPGEYYGIVIFSVLAMMLLAASGELLTAYISLELMSFSLYILASYARDNAKSNEAGVKYILLGAFSSALLLYGISLVYGTVGETRFDAIRDALAGMETLSPQLIIGLVLIVAGLGFKVAAVPFHMWAPDIYEGAPTPVTAYLAVGSKAAAFALMLRLFAQAFMPIMDQWQIIVAILGALTMTVGNLVAIAQHNIKRLLAYSSIGQVGYLLIGIAALSPAASNALILHLAAYAFTNMAAFMCVIAFFNSTGKEEISDFAGLAERAPLVALAMTVALFSLAGLPFFAGFVSKFYLFTAAAREGLLWLAGLAILNSLISLYYYLIIIKQMYINPAKDGENGAVKVNALTKGVLLALMAGILVIGLYPGPLVHAIDAATRVILTVGLSS